MKRYAAAYGKARVNVQWRPGNYDQQTAAALLTENAPDVFEGGPTLDQIRGGQVADLTGLLKGVRDDFHPAVLAPKTYQGKVYGIPQVIDTQMLYYRKSLLDKAGVRPPGTLDELIDAAKALTTKDVKGLFLGNDGGAGVLGATRCAPPAWNRSPPTGKSGSTTRGPPRPLANCTGSTPTAPSCSVHPPTGPTRPRSSRG